MEIKDILKSLAMGEMSVEDAYSHLKYLPFKRLDTICIDSHREIRTGDREVIFGMGKGIDQLRTILSTYPDKDVLVTKLDKHKGRKLQKLFPHGKFHEISGLFVMGKDISMDPPWKETGDVVILTAGSSDIPIALETYGCAQFFGLDVALISDVGVAGIHRIFPYLKTLEHAKIIIVVAGMEGALPSVVAGLTGKPILAVPTSVGYGTSFKGISSLLGMLNSCAGGVSVLNIDNGFGAALMASKIFKSFKNTKF